MSAAGGHIARCACGDVELELTGAPITVAACYCDDCQQAGHRFEARAETPTVLRPDGSTEYVLQRKDRVNFSKGTDLLRSFRLDSASKTRRVWASCCGSPIFVEFKHGHWLSVYRDRVAGDPPPIEVRTMTKYAANGGVFDDEIPSFASHNGRFFWQLLTAWAAMGFRTPRLPPIEQAQIG